MILQNISKAIREQNYYAVALEFVIVIAGVVIGFQINAWAQARSSEQSFTDALVRLHDDVERLQDYRTSSRDFFEDRLGDMLDGMEIIFDDDPRAELTDSQCLWVAASHYASVPNSALPTLDEVLGSGLLERSQSSELRREISRYVSVLDEFADRTNLERRFVDNLIETFPEIGDFELVSPEEGDGADQRAQAVFRCDLDAMRASAEFKAALVENIGRQEAAVGFNAALDDRLDALHAAVDLELGIGHSDDTGP